MLSHALYQLEMRFETKFPRKKVEEWRKRVERKRDVNHDKLCEQAIRQQIKQNYGRYVSFETDNMQLDGHEFAFGKATFERAGKEYVIHYVRNVPYRNSRSVRGEFDFVIKMDGVDKSSELHNLCSALHLGDYSSAKYWFDTDKFEVGEFKTGKDELDLLVATHQLLRARKRFKLKEKMMQGIFYNEQTQRPEALAYHQLLQEAIELEAKCPINS